MSQSIIVQIQDVDPLNSKIFENGWMYVGHYSQNNPAQYFAPYFTEECEHSGLSRISRILHIVHYQVSDLLGDQLAPPDAPSEQHRLKWRIGLDRIRVRARIESWEPERMGTLLYLERPETFRSPSLSKKTYNDATRSKKLGPSRIPFGFTLEYAELLTKASWILEEPPGSSHVD